MAAVQRGDEAEPECQNMEPGQKGITCHTVSDLSQSLPRLPVWLRLLRLPKPSINLRLPKPSAAEACVASPSELYNSDDDYT